MMLRLFFITSTLALLTLVLAPVSYALPASPIIHFNLPTKHAQDADARPLHSYIPQRSCDRPFSQSHGKDNEMHSRQIDLFSAPHPSCPHTVVASNDRVHILLSDQNGMPPLDSTALPASTLTLPPNSAVTMLPRPTSTGRRNHKDTPKKTRTGAAGKTRGRKAYRKDRGGHSEAAIYQRV